MTSIIKVAEPNIRRTSYSSQHEAYCCLVLSVILRAKEDAAGTVEQRPPDKQKCVDIVRDAIAYFADGRYAWHMELMGRDPEVMPDWNGDK